MGPGGKGPVPPVQTLPPSGSPSGSPINRLAHSSALEVATLLPPPQSANPGSAAAYVCLLATQRVRLWNE